MHGLALRAEKVKYEGVWGTSTHSMRLVALMLMLPSLCGLVTEVFLFWLSQVSYTNVWKCMCVWARQGPFIDWVSSSINTVRNAASDVKTKRSQPTTSGCWVSGWPPSSPRECGCFRLRCVLSVVIPCSFVFNVKLSVAVRLVVGARISLWQEASSTSCLCLCLSLSFFYPQQYATSWSCSRSPTCRQ